MMLVEERYKVDGFSHPVISKSWDPMDYRSPPGSSVCVIFHAGILELGANSFSRGSSWPRDRTQVYCIAGRLFTDWATRDVFHLYWISVSIEVFKNIFPLVYMILEEKYQAILIIKVLQKCSISVKTNLPAFICSCIVFLLLFLFWYHLKRFV